MDLVEKWSAFLPHAEHISPTQFCAITLGDVREMIAEYQALRARVAELEASLDKSVAQASKFYDDYQEIAAEHYRHERVCAGVWVPVGERLPPFTKRDDSPGLDGEKWAATLSSDYVVVTDGEVTSKDCLISREGSSETVWWGGRREWTHWLDVKLPTSSGEEKEQ